MIITIVILSVIVVVLGFTTINLLRKNEKQEDIMNNLYDNLMTLLSNNVVINNTITDKLLCSISGGSI